MGNRVRIKCKECGYHVRAQSGRGMLDQFWMFRTTKTYICPECKNAEVFIELTGRRARIEALKHYINNPVREPSVVIEQLLDALKETNQTHNCSKCGDRMKVLKSEHRKPQKCPICGNNVEIKDEILWD